MEFYINTWPNVDDIEEFKRLDKFFVERGIPRDREWELVKYVKYKNVEVRANCEKYDCWMPRYYELELYTKVEGTIVVAKFEGGTGWWAEFEILPYTGIVYGKGTVYNREAKKLLSLLREPIKYLKENGTPRVQKAFS